VVVYFAEAGVNSGVCAGSTCFVGVVRVWVVVGISGGVSMVLVGIVGCGRGSLVVVFFCRLPSEFLIQRLLLAYLARSCFQIVIPFHLYFSLPSYLLYPISVVPIVWLVCTLLPCYCILPR
jgi:hypothetical protein